MIRNLHEASMNTVVGMHDGVGPMAFSRVFDRGDFQSPIDFVDYAVLPPGSSIGSHRHGSNEELYLVLQGSGSMTLGDRQFDVKEGDLIVNPNGGSHGLVNNGDRNIRLFVVQVAIDSNS